MSVLSQVPGLPGMRAVKTVSSRVVTRGGWIPDILPQGRVIAGACSRDPGNTPDVGRLRAGLLMGKIGSVVNSLGAVGFYAPSVLDVTAGSLASNGTTITLSVAGATELVRRCGATGTFKLTGPPTAAGVVRTVTATYSAVVLATGVVTLTAPGVNEVQRVNFNIASSGGTVTLLVPTAAGVMQQTTPVTWSATDATYLASLNTALDVASGVAGGIVATAIPAVDTDLGFVLTFSGTGFAALPQPLVSVVGTLPTSSTAWNVTRTTAGVDGRFVAGSLVQPTDGSDAILTFLPNGGPVMATDFDGNSLDVEFGELPIGCVVDDAQLLPWPADASLRTYVRQALSTVSGGKFTFSSIY